MKKFILVTIMAFFSVLSAMSIPGGTYSPDGRYGNKVFVDNSGKTLYVLDKEGNVLAEWAVIEETRSDKGYFFVLKSKNGAVLKRNAWWKEDGQVYLNMEGQPNTLIKD